MYEGPNGTLTGGNTHLREYFDYRFSGPQREGSRTLIIVHIYEEPNGLLVGDKRNLRQYFNYAVFEAPQQEGRRTAIHDKR